MDDESVTANIVDLTEQLMHLAMHDFFRYMRSTGLSLAQMNVLMYLYYKGPAEVMTFSQYMNLSPAGASQLIDRMVQQDLVEREPSPDDRRVRLVAIKPFGRSIIEGSIAERRGKVKDILALMDDHEAAILSKALGLLHEKKQRLETEKRRSME